MKSPAAVLAGLAVDSLAAYRVARLVVSEDAPVSVAARQTAGRLLPEPWRPALGCEHCTGLWAALGFAGLRAAGLGALAYPLAAAGLQSLLVAHVGEGADQGFTEPQGLVGPALSGRPISPRERSRAQVYEGDSGWGRFLSTDELAAGRLYS